MVNTANLITIIFRMYGIFNFVFGFMAVSIAVTAFRRGERWAWWTLLIGNTIAVGSAITFDRVVNAIGIFEMTEYLGLAIVYVALAITFGLKPARPADHARAELQKRAMSRIRETV
jgi:hypothetical protein